MKWACLISDGQNDCGPEPRGCSFTVPGRLGTLRASFPTVRISRRRIFAPESSCNATARVRLTRCGNSAVSESAYSGKPRAGSPRIGSRSKSATASGVTRSHQWRSMASTKTTMSGRPGRCDCARPACAATQRHRRTAGSHALWAQGHAGSYPAGQLARLRPQVRVAVERRRIHSQGHPQLALLRHPGGRSFRDAGGRGLLETCRGQDVPLGKDLG